MSLNKPNSATELYEEYKTIISHHSNYICKLKIKVSAIIAKKQLVSFMNDTKWLELQYAVKELSFPPPYILRCVTDGNDIAEPFFEKIPWWIGDWSNYYHEGLPALFNIEWIKVCPQLSKYRGRLVENEVLDETEAFRTILNRLNIPYDRKDNIFTIYGYKNP